MDNGLIPPVFIMKQHKQFMDVTAYQIDYPSPNHQYVSICSTEVYSFMGMNLSQTGIYTDSVRFANGCDSVYRLHLTVNPIYFFQTNHNMCDNQSFLWRDSLVENLPAGLHLLYDSMQTASGCDSIYCLRLIVRPTTRIYVYDTICQGQSLRFLTQNYTVEGVYEVTQVQANGCDRVLQLNLKVHPVYFNFKTRLRFA